TGAGSVAARPGAVYAGRLQLRAASTAATARAQLRWYDATGTEIAVDRVSGYAIADGAAGWTSYAVSGLAPARAASVALAADLTVTTPGQTHDVARPSLTVATAAAGAVRGPLRTVGNKVVDADGQVVVLRGFNRSGQYDQARPANLTSDDVGRIASWGANVVRVTLGEALWLPGCPQYDASYAAAVDDDVRWITSRGMVAVLDLQYSAPTCDSAALNPLADAGSLTFWQQVAARYKSNPLVAFDVYNEPNHVTAEQWRDGGTVQSVAGRSYRGVGMKALYDAVRSTGAQNLVLVGTLDYAAAWPSTGPLAGASNVVYAVHAYNCDRPSACTNGTGSAYLLDRFAAAGTTVPIMVSEFGWPTGGAPQAYAFDDGVIAYAEAQGWGWAAWDWSRDGRCDADTWFSVIAPGTCGAGGTQEPAVAGQPILVGLTRNR
ncbi:MAG: cellulose-binding family, partial [Frankiales bacterium]|nr:cellulose-binding family [Frankiales bacterium]